MTRAYQLPTHPATDEFTLLLESRDALRRVILDDTASPNSIAKASSELRHVLLRIAELEKAAPPKADDPIESIRLRTLATVSTAPKPRKRTSK